MRLRLAALSVAALLSSATLARAQLVGPGYQPADKDERGLWMQMDEAERRLKTSSFVITDPALNAYVRAVFCRTVGQDACKDVRVYISRTPYFNATMAANGMLEVWSGLLIRVRDEAQLSAVLGHEYTHYQSQHSLKLYRKLRSTAGAATFLTVGLGAVGTLAALGMMSSLFDYSQDNEREADSGGLALAAKAGYDPAAAPEIWEQLRQEQLATATGRAVKPRYDNGGLFSTHPNSLERMAAMKAQAATLAPGGARNAAEYRKALSPWWPEFIDDQIKLNDFGATDLLLANLASAGWTPDLLFARGELYRAGGTPDDLKKAADFYRQLIAGTDAPPEAYRGLGLALLRSGSRDEGQAALKTYLAKKPDGADRPMIAMLAGA